MTNAIEAPASITRRFAELEQLRKMRNNEPRMGNFFGTIYLAVTTVALAYGGLLGSAAIVVMYAIWLPKVVYKGVFLLRPSRDVVFALLMPMLAIISAAWSEYPSNSLKSSMEYTSLIFCTIIISKIVTTKAYIRGLIIGTTIALGASLFSQQYGLDPMTGQYTLIGLFGSQKHDWVIFGGWYIGIFDQSIY